MARITSIVFHREGSTDSVTVPLRRNLTVPVARPEWQTGVTTTAADSPIAYDCSAVGRHVPVIGVTVEREVGDPASLELRALALPSRGRPLPPAVLTPPDLRWPANYWFSSPAEYLFSLWYSSYYRAWQESRERTPHVLGAVQATVVRFPAGARTATTFIPLLGNQMAGHGVGSVDVIWRWQTRVPGSVWRDAVTTEHRVYLLLQAPKAPWHARAATADDNQVLWTGVLEVACRWASGCLNAVDAAEDVTQAVNGLGGLVEYGCPIGALTMYAAPLGLDAFDCTSFLELLDGQQGNGRYVNCSDCATVVSTFANALGCDLWQSRMGSYIPAFETNPMQAIGTDRIGSPCGWGLGFTYHEVAWTGSCGLDDEVFDACCRIATGGLSTRLPVDLKFGAEGTGQYGDLIAAPTTRWACVPRPQERRRRVLI